MARWIIDSDHSSAAFAVKHMALARVRGQFSDIKGTIHYDPADRSSASVEVSIAVASVHTGNRKRDEHLMTNEFFDQAIYPQITFKSRSIEFLNGDRCRVTGELTMHGTVRVVDFEGEFAGPRSNPYGDEISIGFSGTASVDREDFGILWGSEPMEGGGMVAGKEVQIFLDVEADKAE